MPSIEKGPREEENEQMPNESIERQPDETALEHLNRLRKMAELDKAKISKGDAEAGAVDQGKRGAAA